MQFALQARQVSLAAIWLLEVVGSLNSRRNSSFGDLIRLLYPKHSLLAPKLEGFAQDHLEVVCDQVAELLAGIFGIVSRKDAEVAWVNRFCVEQ